MCGFPVSGRGFQADNSPRPSIDGRGTHNVETEYLQGKQNQFLATVLMPELLRPGERNRRVVLIIKLSKWKGIAQSVFKKAV